MSNEFDSFVEDLLIIANNCPNIATSFGQAFGIIGGDVHIVKIPDQRLDSVVIHRQNGTTGMLPNLITNFRAKSGINLGHLDTNRGKVPVPKFWPASKSIQEEYGPPRRDGEDLIVDAYVLDDFWSAKLHRVMTRLPHYPEWDGAAIV